MKARRAFSASGLFGFCLLELRQIIGKGCQTILQQMLRHLNIINHRIQTKRLKGKLSVSLYHGFHRYVYNLLLPVAEHGWYLRQFPYRHTGTSTTASLSMLVISPCVFGRFTA